MNHAADLPLWAALVASFLVLLGASLTLVGAIGLVRLKTFYDRLHAPSLGATWGTGGILLASILLFSVLQSRLVLHEVLIAVFLTVTTPVTLMLLGRAALYRDRSENVADPPPPIRTEGETRSGNSI
jgi:multicomponent K+:H+ antiporter subunit G